MAISVTPASRPSRVRCVNQVAATVSKSTKNNQPRAGKGLAFHAKTARQSMMAATMAAHHTGTWGMSGISWNVLFNVLPAPASIDACAFHLGRGQFLVEVSANHKSNPVDQPVSPKRTCATRLLPHWRNPCENNPSTTLALGCVARRG